MPLQRDHSAPLPQSLRGPKLDYKLAWFKRLSAHARNCCVNVSLSLLLITITSLRRK
jgi:hypothetical protein